MKAIVCRKYGSPEVLEFREVEKPVPKDGEILVKVGATSVTVADCRVRSFRVPPSFWLPARLALGLTRPRRPILGVELAGTVESVGRDVKRFQVGDKVFAATLSGFGAYAEYKCLREDGPVCLMPSNVAFSEAAALPVGARTAMHYLKKAGVGNGSKVLVYGASGSVGSYAVQLAAHFGAEVTGVCSTANLEMVKALGAAAVIDYTREDFSTRGGSYDVVFEAVDKSGFAACMRALKPDGIYVNITTPLPGPAMIWAKLTTRRKLILGENSAETAEDLIEIKNLVEAGKLKAVLDRCYPFDRMIEAHHYVDQGHKKGNVAITLP
jgi:NADPH:quinone reductase-like Zn-dependent oxidoreductase